MSGDGLKQGAKVRLAGLKTEVLNGAIGKINGPLDPDSGRWPVALESPESVADQYPGGVKVKPENLEVVKRQQRAQAASEPSGAAAGLAAHMRKLGVSGAAKPAPNGWAKGLDTARKRAEWFVDCYRMRIDDEYAWGGGILRGLYEPEHTADSVLEDFLIFCNLAVKHGCVPVDQPWSWKTVLEVAGEELMFAFEKSDAQSRWGGENVFDAMSGGRSLRYTAGLVYGQEITQMDNANPALERMERVVKAGLDQWRYGGPSTVFDEVGPASDWKQLQQKLEAAFEAQAGY